jgi:hypothetical protein
VGFCEGGGGAVLFFAGGLAGVEDQVVGFWRGFVWEELAEEPEDSLGLRVLGAVRFYYSARP